MYFIFIIRHSFQSKLRSQSVHKNFNFHKYSAQNKIFVCTIYCFICSFQNSFFTKMNMRREKNVMGYSLDEIDPVVSLKRCNRLHRNACHGHSSSSANEITRRKDTRGMRREIELAWRSSILRA